MSRGAGITVEVGAIRVSLDLKHQNCALHAVSQKNGVDRSSFHKYSTFPDPNDTNIRVRARGRDQGPNTEKEF